MQQEIDPGGTRYPGSRDRSWWQAYGHRWLRRWERPGASDQRRVWTHLKQRLRAMFNPHWVP